MNGSIKIVDYNPAWPKQFQELRSVFMSVLGDHIISIEHVGSTAVPGLVAKPVIDMDIIVADEFHLNKVIPPIALLGYRFMGSMGIKDRYAFKRVTEYSPLSGTAGSWPDHHLYCCIDGTTSLNNHLMFRDALRNDPDLATQYGDLKRKLASLTDDMEIYVESKSAFIADVLRQAGISVAEIEDIVSQNRKR